VAELKFPLLHSKQDWESGPTPAAIGQTQAAITWANHLVILYPLWLGAMPVLLKAFLEQVSWPGFAFEYGSRDAEETAHREIGAHRRHHGQASLRLSLILSRP